MCVVMDQGLHFTVMVVITSTNIAEVHSSEPLSALESLRSLPYIHMGVKWTRAAVQMGSAAC